MRSVSSLMKALDRGDHLTTAEMARLRDFYHEVTVAVTPFGARYELMFMDALTQERKLDEYLHARGVTVPAKERLVYNV